MPAPKISESGSDQAFLGRRDAFHTPGVLCRSGEYLDGGDTVRFTNTDLTEVASCGKRICHGVVDPFLLDGAAPGDIFWVLLTPGLTSGLTHNFNIQLDQNAIDSAEREDSSSECRSC